MFTRFVSYLCTPFNGRIGWFRIWTRPGTIARANNENAFSYIPEIIPPVFILFRVRSYRPFGLHTYGRTLRTRISITFDFLGFSKRFRNVKITRRISRTGYSLVAAKNDVSPIFFYATNEFRFISLLRARVRPTIYPKGYDAWKLRNVNKKTSPRKYQLTALCTLTQRSKVRTGFSLTD